MDAWYVLYTKPHKETLVNQQLEERELATFFPYVQYDRGYGRGVRLEPLFPSYLFVRVDLTSSAASGLTWLVGVRHLVSFEDRPARVPDAVVEALEARLAPFTKKVLAETEVLFSPGETVRILSGPLAGLEGIFQRGVSGSQRVQILLNMLGQWSRVDLDARQLVSTQRRDPVAVRALAAV
jgi:transcriptional antiterminator RfaH